MLTNGQVEMLRLASERENGVGKGDIPPGYKHRPRRAWWRNIDQLESNGLVARIGHRYVATPAGDAALLRWANDQLPDAVREPEGCYML